MRIDEMRELRGNRAEMVIKNYRFYMSECGYYTVNDVYKSCSIQKQYAERNIIREMIENNGYSYCIVGVNVSTFSCAYRCGEWLVYHTRDNVYKIKYPAYAGYTRKGVKFS